MVQWEDQKTQFQKTFVFVTFFLVSWLIGLYGTAAFTDLQHLAYTAIDAPLFWQPSTVSLRFTFNHKTLKAKLTKDHQMTSRSHQNSDFQTHATCRLVLFLGTTASLKVQPL